MTVQPVMRPDATRDPGIDGASARAWR